ncbi:class II aldolase/adducin family protein [Tundrisphaera lichenicola]|uniref:class II aldolase/adducin family protein n=1 Tax=Tundrisphaera lichenicola TaxID=2029860 RepID=UPI003EC155F2
MSRTLDLIHPRDEILRTMERIYRYRMTTTSGGNLSILDDEGDIWITPARLDKGSLRRDDIVRVRPDGSHEGPHRPSSEYPFHQAIYRARPDLRGIVHAHPVALVAFSICRKVPETAVLHQTRKICGKVGFAPYALPGSATLGRNIAETFGTGVDCVVLENHGVVTVGGGLQQAFERFETLEFAAKTLIKAGILGKVRTLDSDPADLSPRPPSAPPFEPDFAMSREKDLRRQLSEFVRRAYQQRLMISTQGAFSARLDVDTFLITAHGVDRSRVDVGDLVLIHQGKPESGKEPSGSARNHRAIYQSHPTIQSIVNAYPVNASAFGVTGTTLDSRTIPESYLFLKDVGRVPYGVQFGDGQELARLASPKAPILILENDGVQVWGTSVLDAFDRLEVLETTAEAMINSRPIGSMVPMSDDAIAELNRAFDL